jgi:Na+/H+-translocating membrane pyrophosphatase
LVATGFALLLTRSEESDNVSSALLRGPLASVVFSVAALLGATLWLLGKDRYMPFFLSGTVGAIGSLLVGLSGHLRPRRGNAAPRELEETARLSSALALAASQATAFLRAAWTSAPLLVCVGIGWSLLPLLGVDGWPLSLAMVVTGYFATHSHTAALYGFDSVMDSASGLGSLTDAHAHPEVQNRLSSLVGAATHVGAIARDALGTGTALLSLTATALCYLVLSESGAPGPSSAATSGAVPSLVWIAVGAISGLITILLFCGSVIRHLVGAATKLKQELERQLRGFARGVSGLVELPSDFKPRYRDHLESASREALSRVEFPCALGLLLPLTLFLTIASLEPRTEGPTLALTLVSFVGAVSLGGLVIAKLSDSTHASWTAAYRTARPPQPETAGTRSPIDHGISATTSALATTELFVVAAACAGLLVAALLF